MSTVDVVIPAFNAALHLREALASVLAQSHAVARVIVVDDASTDTTAQIVGGYGAPVELIALGRNGGAAAARNAGIAAADASYIAFLDADDRWMRDHLAIQCAALDADAAAMFCLCRTREFASDELDAAERAALVQRDTTQLEGWLASALVARREVFVRIGGFASDLRVGEAIEWFGRARELPHVHVDAVGVERRLHRANSTRRAAVTGSDYVEAVRRHLARRRAAKPT
ncbi:MAG TPA: glycosyltransferase family A protein [Casimicrobiaceae bacterium]|jgi:glycosyltransferase involved in cell wall biosynthesis|nr:glycosyltransferase family A protein [Casimicrobiaceae bacterium]